MSTSSNQGLELRGVISCFFALFLIAAASAGCVHRDATGDGTTSGGSDWTLPEASGAGGTGEAAGDSGAPVAVSGGQAGSEPIITGTGAGAGAGGGGGEGGSPGEAGAAGSAGAVVDGTCGDKAAGVYGFRLDMDVFWTPLPDLLLTSTTDPGRGRLRVYVQANIARLNEDGSFEAEIHPCGIELPIILSTALCDYYKPEVPESIWDSVAPDTVQGRFTGFDPGSAIEIPLTSYLYGIELDDPDATWPTAAGTGTFSCASGTGSDCFPDYDGDGEKGLTIIFGKIGDRGGDTCGTGYWEYSTVPLSLDLAALAGGAARADQMYMGARLRASLGGTIDSDCESGAGKAEASAFEIRLEGCRWEEGTVDSFGNRAGPDQPCDANQAVFLDLHLPVYIPLKEGEIRPATFNSMDLFTLDLLGLFETDVTPSEGATSAFVRVADPGTAVTCDQIRSAAYRDAGAPRVPPAGSP